MLCIHTPGASCSGSFWLGAPGWAPGALCSYTAAGDAEREGQPLPGAGARTAKWGCIHSPFYLCRNYFSSGWYVLHCKILVGRGGCTADVLRGEGWGHPGCLSGQYSFAADIQGQQNQVLGLIRTSRRTPFQETLHAAPGMPLHSTWGPLPTVLRQGRWPCCAPFAPRIRLGHGHGLPPVL